MKAEILELNREDALLCDKEQWYKEQEETQTYGRGKNKVTETALVGRVYWKQGFKDDDTDDVVWIERSEIAKINGEWQGDLA